MANFYLDISAIGNEYQAYTDTPTTWAVPQDGNGKAGPGHSAAVGIATLDCASASASGAGALQIMGQSVSTTLTGSGSTLATNIVTAINASATATTATYSAALLPVNKLVFARVHPTINTTVQIMMRIAGTDWESLPPTTSGTWGTTPTITGFTGGSDGPFAYFFANVAGVFGKSVLQWGVFSIGKSAGVSDPGATDVINIRTQRSGVDLNLTYNNSSYIQTALVPAGATRIGVFDNGTLWTGDSGQLTIQCFATTGFANSYFFLSTDSSVGYLRLSSADSSYRGRFYLGGSVYGWSFRAQYSYSEFYAENILFETQPTAVSGMCISVSLIGAGCVAMLDRCKFIEKGGSGFHSLTASGGTKGIYHNCLFEFFSLSSNVSGFITGSAGNNCAVEFVGCIFYDRNGVYSIVNPINIGAMSNQPIRIVFDGCAGISDVAINTAASAESERGLMWDNYGSYRDFRTEAGLYLSEWRYGKNFPTLRSKLPNGTLWSIKVLLRAENTWQLRHRIARLFTTYRSSSAVRTISVDFMAQQVFKKASLALMVVYTDTGDVVRTESGFSESIATAITGTGADVATSGESWTLNGASGFTAYKLSLTTAYSVKTNTEMNVYVIWRGPLGFDQTIYIDPTVVFT